VRDKIAGVTAQGQVGPAAPFRLGYDSKDKKLVVNKG